MEAWIALYVGLTIAGICTTTAQNDRPIIGVLAQETEPPAPGDTYIEQAYINYLEMAGARVVPIRISEKESYYIQLFNHINGVLFPGGAVSLYTSGYAKAAKILYNLALKANDRGDYFPMWGTCLGFEQLLELTAGTPVLMTDCDCYDISLPLNPLPGARSSRMLRQMGDELFDVLISDDVTSNFHTSCMTPKNFTANEKLTEMFDILTVNRDKNNILFISSIEAYKYPIYGTQWHPEKNIYIWDLNHPSLNHSNMAVKLAQYFANFFVNEARRSKHHFPDLKSESAALIYNFNAYYSGQPSFMMNYYFNVSSNHGGHTHGNHGGRHHDDALKIHPYSTKSQHPYDHHRPANKGDLKDGESSGIAQEHTFILMGIGMVACLVVGIQIGRCLEAHSQTDSWPDVLQWMLNKSDERRRGTHIAGRRRSSGQRVKLLQQDKHYFTFDNSMVETAEL